MTNVVSLNDIPNLLWYSRAAPPCTEFSIAKGAEPRDFEEAMNVVQACMRIIWLCRTYGNLKVWALENPVGFLRQFLGIPKYTFEQWQFGEFKRKRTDIWGCFREPLPMVKIRPEKLTTRIGHKSHALYWTKPEIPEEYKHLNLSRAARAITPRWFAEAFFRANK